MDDAWKNIELTPDGTLTHIFQEFVICEFKGFDGKHFRLSGETGDSHYLGFDFFNPLTNKAGGKQLSVGILSLACLNLPLEMHYQPENMFLAGIIPGPKEPPLDAINSYIKPIVDVFLEFWTEVYFTKTLQYNLGQMMFCAIALVICDSPAAQKIGGFACHNHEYFCWQCWINKTQFGYNSFDISSWKWQTNDKWWYHANVFYTASTMKASQSSLDTTGLRWSELLRLSYFDMAHFLIVEPMHALFFRTYQGAFSGNFRHLARNLFFRTKVTSIAY